MKTRRDMTESQFRAALDKYGFGPSRMFGYVKLPAPHDNVSVSILNGGNTRRKLLAYLLAEWKHEQERDS